MIRCRVIAFVFWSGVLSQIACLCISQTRRQHVHNAGSGVLLDVQRLQKTGPRFEEAAEFFRQLARSFDEEEAEIVGGLENVRTYIRALVDMEEKYLAVAPVRNRIDPSSIVNAFVNGAGSPVIGVAIVINEYGAWWSSRYSVCGAEEGGVLADAKGGSDLARAIIAIHEISHTWNKNFAPDWGDHEACVANNRLVVAKFPRTIKAVISVRKASDQAKMNSYVE